MSKKVIEFLYLNQDEVKEAGGDDMRLVIDALQEMLKVHSEGKVIAPPKIVLDLNERERGRINAMPAYVGGNMNVCGIKWIAGFPKNPKRYGLPRGIGIIILNDSWNGLPLAIMDGTLISAMRTGAITGIAARYLARKDSKCVAVIGCGVQARTQLLALKTILPSLKNVKAYDIVEDNAKEYAKMMSEKLGIDVVAVRSAKEAVKGSDIIVTATVANEPIVKNEWIEEGSFFSHIGSYQEEDYDTVLNSDKIVVDDWEQVKHRGTPILAKMYNEGLIKDESIYAELHEIVSGKKEGRESDDERIFFSPIGMGSEDVAVAYYVYKNALKKNLGKRLKLFSLSD
jgi:ornithine cyclodeaminase